MNILWYVCFISRSAHSWRSPHLFWVLTLELEDVCSFNTNNYVDHDQKESPELQFLISICFSAIIVVWIVRITAVWPASKIFYNVNHTCRTLSASFQRRRVVMPQRETGTRHKPAGGKWRLIKSTGFLWGNCNVPSVCAAAAMSSNDGRNFLFSLAGAGVVRLQL